MFKQKFTVMLIPQVEGGYQAFFPYYPECTTDGDTVEDALANAKEAIEGVLKVDAETRRRSGFELCVCASRRRWDSGYRSAGQPGGIGYRRHDQRVDLRASLSLCTDALLPYASAC